MLDSLVINNYRNLKELKIDSLGMVNLFIGDNNVGKSSLLEAVAIYAAKGDLNLIYRILRERGALPTVSEEEGDLTESNMTTFSSLFFNREISFEKESAITIGPSDSKFSGNGNSSPEAVSIRYVGYVEEFAYTNEGYQTSKRQRVLEGEEVKETENYKIGIERKVGNATSIIALEGAPRHRFANMGSKFKDNFHHINFQYIQAGNLNQELSGKLWDKITLENKEEYVIDALKLIEPATEKISFIEDRAKERSAFIKLSGEPRMYPLRSMGDGINHLLTIIMAILTADNGYLLIDEFESGLHHSVQADLWEIIFKLSKELNVQVFATTHSEDCIAGFSDSLNSPDNTTTDGKLIRLENRKGAIKIVEYTPKEVRIATERHIETR